MPVYERLKFRKSEFKYEAYRFLQVKFVTSYELLNFS